MALRLNLGSGNETKGFNRNGWVTIDARPECLATYTAEIPPLPDEVMDMRFSVVYANHFWEHLYEWQAAQLAREIVGILEPVGKLILELPNLAKACQHLANDAEDIRLTWWAIYGAQTDPTWVGNIWQAHKWGYTPESITEQLTEAGFRRVEILKATKRMPVVRDMRVEAYV